MTAPVAISSAWHVLSIFLVFISGLLVSRCIGLYVGNKGLRPLFLYMYHLVWCLVFFWYSNIHGADSFGYYYGGLAGEGELRLGTGFVTLLVELLISWFGLSYLGVFLVFNIFGSVGYILFDASLRYATFNSKSWIKKLASLVIFLPSVSFWSSAISKDAISFMAVGAALWASINFKRRLHVLFLSILLMLLVRPHMAGIMVMAISFAMIFERTTSYFHRFFLSLIFIGGAVVLVPYALDYAGVKDGVNIEAVSNFIEKRQSYTKGETSIDIANMPLYEKLLTYVFRPIFFEARNLYELAASLDNLIILFLFFYGVALSFKVSLGHDYGNKIFLLAYSGIAWSVLSLTTANLGIALRQKWMFVPFMIYLAFSYIDKRERIRREAIND